MIHHRTKYDPPPPYFWEEDGRRDAWQAFQTINARSDYQHLSLEELRLKDYKGGKMKSRTPAFSFELHWASEDRVKSDLLDLMQGPGIEIRVAEDSYTQQTWSLPQRLVSYHSDFFKTACRIDLRERNEKLICLPRDSPDVFRLFVEWLYFGKYTLPLMHRKRDDMDRQAWVLGDKLLCREFKEYAMTRLYGSYCGPLMSKRLKPDDIQFACENSPPGAGLRRLIFDIVGTYLPRMDTARLVGTEEEWTAVLDRFEKDCGVARAYLMSQNKPNEVHPSVGYYFDDEGGVGEKLVTLMEMPFWGRVDA